MVLCSQLHCKALLRLCLQSRSELQSSLQAPPRSAVPGGVSSNKAAQTFCHVTSPTSPLLSWRCQLCRCEQCFCRFSKVSCIKWDRSPTLQLPAEGKRDRHSFCPAIGCQHCARTMGLPMVLLPGTPRPCTGTGGGHSMPGCCGFPRIR